MRLLIILALIYIAYRAVKNWLLQNASAARPVDRPSGKEIDDVMIKDPQCNKYFPQRDGVPLRYEGRALYFCSKQCRDQFIAEHHQ